MTLPCIVGSIQRISGNVKYQGLEQSAEIQDTQVECHKMSECNLDTALISQLD